MTEIFGQGDDDNGPSQQNPGTVPSEEGTRLAGFSTQSDPSGTGSSVLPGRRLKNPLGDLSSFTYQISLYMITPDAYDAFVATGRRQINALSELTDGESQGGAFLVAQSGGVNNKLERRAPGFEFDYAIDNLSFKTLTSGKATQTASNTASFKFDITESYGFSFITKLKRAADELFKYNETIKEAYPQNPTRQFFILGIRFYGYDEEGNIADIDDVYEQFYDIKISGVKFKLNGSATTYNIDAASISPSEGFGIKRGRLNSFRVVKGSTVGQAINDLFDKINVQQAELVEAGSIKKANFYEVKFLDGSREIEEASLLAPEDLDKDRWGGAGVRSTTQSNASAETDAKPNPTVREIRFERDTPINQAIGDIVRQSSYLRDALEVVYTSSLEPDPQTAETPEQKPNTNNKIKWYNLSVELSNARWDDIVNDWAYKITYVIQTYETPVFSSAYVKSGIEYYGPHKRYEYYFTGENREVLGYEQKYDNTYFNVALDPSARPLTDAEPGNSAGGPTEVGQIPGKNTNQSRTGRKNSVGNEAQNTYVTSLYDPGAYVKSKMTILGDPDFLMRESPDSVNEIYNKFYGTNGFTINPNGGQVFVEVDFKEAVDYTSDTGTLEINDSILFWRYPKELADKIKGVCYQVRDVTSKFSNGKFEQQLTLDAIDFGSGEAEESESDSTASSEAASPPANRQIKSNLLKVPEPTNNIVTEPTTDDIPVEVDADDDRRG